MKLRTLTLALAVASVAAAFAACGGGAAGKSTDESTGDSSQSSDATATSGGQSGTAGGTMLADLGFRPESDGFAFENYGDGPYTNLTPIEMRRIFGDAVCAALSGSTCTLTPPAEEWMTIMNSTMGGGHCYGFSVAALQLYLKQLKADAFGGKSSDTLKIDGNAKLQQEIAYSFIYQMLDPVRAGEVRGTPNEVLDQLIAYLKKGPSGGESYTIGFFKADMTGGHAVTPFAVQDRGSGQVAVLIYDNNFPKKTREILFDRNKNTWSYEASTNPNEPSSKYAGDANTKTLSLFPTTPGTPQQFCPFCAGSGSAAVPGSGSILASATTAPTLYNEIYLEGDPANHGHLVITDAQGKRTGFVGGKYINEIPGADIREEMFVDDWRYTEEPTYRIPTGVKFTITIDGTGLKKADQTEVVMIGPGYDIGVTGIDLQPGQKDTLTLSADGKSLSYKTDASESPVIIVGFDGKTADYSFAIQGVDVDGGGTINVTLDTTANTISITSAGSRKPGTYGAEISRTTSKGEEVFFHDAIPLAPDDAATFQYGNWGGNKQPMSIVIKHKNGTSETLQLTDDK